VPIVILVRISGFGQKLTDLCNNASMTPSEVAPTKDYAYYASGWIWPRRQNDLVKSMLLFFDGIALALPEDLATETIASDPLLAIPLVERGLLVNFDPANVLDTRTANTLARGLTDLVKRGRWFWMRGNLPTLTPFHYGEPAAPKAARVFEAELFKQGLIERTQDRLVVRLNSDIRLLVLTLFAQALRASLANNGVLVHPITDSSADAIIMRLILRTEGSPEKVFMDDLYRPGMRGSDVMDPRQLEADLINVGADLSSVPLDEVLDFRRQNGAHYRAYAAELRQFLASQSQSDIAERNRARDDRRLQIRDQAAELRHLSRAAFGVRSSVLLLSLIGASWTATHGDLLGALLAALTASTQAIPIPERNVTAYSYLLRIREQLDSG
jgi:hypothetical protein